MSKSRAVRLLAMLTVGGVVFQAGGCFATFTPISIICLVFKPCISA